MLSVITPNDTAPVKVHQKTNELKFPGKLKILRLFQKTNYKTKASIFKRDSRSELNSIKYKPKTKEVE